MSCTFRSISSRMLKKAVQQGRSERRPEAYPPGYIEGLSDARTKLAGFFSILIEGHAFRAANTSVTCPPTLTLRKIAFNLPVWSITNVLRSMPQYFLPYIFFSL